MEKEKTAHAIREQLDQSNLNLSEKDKRALTKSMEKIIRARGIRGRIALYRIVYQTVKIAMKK